MKTVYISEIFLVLQTFKCNQNWKYTILFLIKKIIKFYVMLMEMTHTLNTL